MEKKFKLGVIGAGFMSSAIISGVLGAHNLLASQIIVSDINDEALAKISEKGVAISKDNLFLANNSEFVLLAIKPQNANAVFEQIAGADCEKFISIMAGVKKEKIKAMLGNVSVARCMPNTPCSVGYGAVGIDLVDYTDEKDVLFIKKLFTSFADVVAVSEDKLGAVTGVSGSSPAYFYLFIKSIVDAGVKLGLTEAEAKTLAVNTMIGSGKMIQQNPDKSLDELIGAVCSKGGTTIEAVKVFEESGISQITFNAVNACVNRSKELEQL